MADDNNTCVICLESLASEETPIGATVPCGHCFHVECFEGWQTSKLGSRRSRMHHHPLDTSGVKCPMCNKETLYFCKIFLDLGAVVDDDVSLSSEEGYPEDDETSENDAGENDAGDGEEAVQDDDEPKNASQDEVSVVINNGPVESSKSSATSSASAPSDAESKYKQKAKQLKSRVKRLETQCRKQSEQQRELLEKHEHVQKELEAKNQRMDALNEKHEQRERELEHVNLKMVQLGREHVETLVELNATRKAAVTAQSRLQKFQEEHHWDLEKAQADSMTEVKEILAQHKHLVKQNEELRQQLNRQRRDSSHTDCNIEIDNDLRENRLKSVNQAAKAAKNLRAIGTMDDDRRIISQKARQKQEHDVIKKRLQGKVSSNAARISRAYEKTASSRGPLDALDAVDQVKPMMMPKMHKPPKRRIESGSLSLLNKKTKVVPPPPTRLGGKPTKKRQTDPFQAFRRR